VRRRERTLLQWLGVYGLRPEQHESLRVQTNVHDQRQLHDELLRLERHPERLFVERVLQLEGLKPCGYRSP
jgi:hypothetical protein